MLKTVLICLHLTLAFSVIQKGYTITNLKQYNNEHFGANDNTTHVIVGTYLIGKGNVDAQKILESPYTFNINTNQALRGKTKYLKVFGSEENYENLIKVAAATIASDINGNQQLKQAGSFQVIDWDHLLESNLDIEQTQYMPWLQNLLAALPDSILKIPAHYLCKNIGGTPFFRHLNHKNYIIEMYGKENPYLTYDSIFSKKDYQAVDGYTVECPKNPSTLKLKEILDSAKFHIQKSLNTEYRGYVGEMSEWIKQAEANKIFDGIVFFDTHPKNYFRL